VAGPEETRMFASYIYRTRVMQILDEEFALVPVADHRKRLLAACRHAREEGLGPYDVAVRYVVARLDALRETLDARGEIVPTAAAEMTRHVATVARLIDARKVSARLVDEGLGHALRELRACCMRPARARVA